ncbi:MAG: hypothetical protein H6852_13415 [Geminicoccaceae bacterium]|jgi:hypothetical protein|nr:hypothetical protein [Geminicoccaceae bacterium]MCB9968619.1 hypothetical protein [Geminicoccaceae bacterium]HRY23175.1 DUF6134 family protein [Geminicoccaceae bacterium]
MQRRDVLRQGAGLVAGAALVGGIGPALAVPAGELRFAVFRNDREIGHHTLRFTPAGERLTVDIEIELEVRFAFITAYRYSHENREEWSNGQLAGFSSVTDDNGTLHRVEASRQGGRVVIDGSEGQLTAPAGVLPATWWHADFIAGGRWINTQTGEIIASTVTALGQETVEAEGRSVTAERFRLAGDVDMDLWYAGERWVKLAFNGPDESRIDYRKVEGGAYSDLTYRPGEQRRA